MPGWRSVLDHHRLPGCVLIGIDIEPVAVHIILQVLDPRPAEVRSRRIAVCAVKLSVEIRFPLAERFQRGIIRAVIEGDGLISVAGLL